LKSKGGKKKREGSFRGRGGEGGEGKREGHVLERRDHKGIRKKCRATGEEKKGEGKKGGERHLFFLF